MMFSLLVAASILASALRRRGEMVLGGGILLAAVLKLYPIAAIVCLLRRNRRPLAVVLTTITVFACWAYYWRDDLSLVRVNTPEFAWRSFGYKTFFISAFQYVFKPPVQTDTAGYLASTHLPPVLEVIATLALLLAILTSVALGFRTRRRWAIDLELESEGQCRFLIGASIYVLTFALGTNFNYRLIFLLLCIPQLVGWAVDVRMSASFRRFATVLGVGILAMCWVSATPERTMRRVPTEIVSWCLFVGFGIIMTNQFMPLLAIFRRPKAH
jgi:hypothetical protein